MNPDTWTKAKRRVNDRDEGLCQKCLREATTIHHRMPKGSGGTSEDWRNYGWANLIALCDECHRHVHSHPEESYHSGFLVKTGMKPEEIPILLANDTIVIYLTADGNVEKYQQQALF